MKKTITIIAVVLFALSSVCAWQQNFNQSSEEVQTFYLLRRLSGTATAEPVFPISSSQLLGMLQKLDTSKFGKTEIDLYNRLVDKLSVPEVLVNIDDVGMDVELSMLLSGYNKVVNPQFFPLAEKPNLVDLNLAFNITPYFAAEFDLNVSVWGHNKPTDSIINMVKIWLDNDLDLMMPIKAYGSVGTKYFNFTAGRDKISSDTGITGNLTFNDNFPQEDYLKASLVKGKFSYDWTLISFDEAANKAITFENPRKYVVNHRMTFAFDKLTLSADEGALMYMTSIFTDPRVLNPFMLIHNYFSFLSGNTNNFFSLNASYNLIPGLELNAQVFFDQIQLPKFEDISTGAGSNAFLANVKYSHVLGEGILTAYAEGAYISNGCYLKAKSQNYNKGAYSIDKVDLVAQFKSPWNVDLGTFYLGYPYGSSSKVLSAGASYLYKGQNFMLDFLMINKGPYGVGKNEQRDSGEKPLEGYSNNSTTFAISVGAEGTVYKALSYDCAFSLNMSNNKDHAKTAFAVTPEFKVCISVDPMVFIKRHSL